MKMLIPIIAATAIGLGAGMATIELKHKRDSDLEHIVVTPVSTRPQTNPLAEYSDPVEAYTALANRPDITDQPTKSIILMYAHLNHVLLIPASRSPQAPAWYREVPNILPAELLSAYKNPVRAIDNWAITAPLGAQAGARIKRTYELARAAQDPAALPTPDDDTLANRALAYIITHDTTRKPQPLNQFERDATLLQSAGELNLTPDALKTYLAFYTKFKLDDKVARH